MVDTVFGRSALVVALGMITASPAFAGGSTVSNSSQLSNQAVGSAAAGVASSQTATIISAGATGGFSAGGAGGFSTGGSGGFSAPAGGGSGGFTPGGGGSAPSGSGGSGGFSPGGGEGGGGTTGPSAAPSGPTSFNYRADGKASGSDEARTGFWTQALVANVNKTEAFMQMRGNAYDALFGIDRRYFDRYVVGLAAGYEYDDMKTTFNQGTYKSQGPMVAPYIAVNVTPAWVFDVSAGYAWLSYDTARQNNAVRGSFDGARTFASSDLTGGYSHQNWRFQPKLSITFSHEQQNSFTDSTGAAVGRNYFELGRLSGGGKAGYAVGNLLPYIKLLGEWDFRHSAAVLKSNGQMSEVDDGGGVAGLGVELNRGGHTGSLEVDYNSLGRQDLDVWMLIGRYHYAF